MTLTNERIIDVLKQVVPEEDAEKIIFYLQGKSNISEFIIAEELDLEIHRTRNLLYKLLDVNLVSFKRKKDKIKGWYICYWDFNDSIIPHLEEKLRLDTIKKIKSRLANEAEGFFYMCKYAHVRQSFEDAFEDNFKCPECGDLMNQVDNSRTIEFLKSRLAKLEEEQAVFQEKKDADMRKMQELARKEREAEQKKLEELEKKKKALEAKKLENAKKKLEREKLLQEKKVLEDKKKILDKTKKEAVTKKKSSSTKKKVVVKKSAPVKKKSVSVKKSTVVKKKAVTKNKSVVKKSASKEKSPVKKAVSVKKKTVKKTTASKKTTSKKKVVKKKTLAKKIGGMFKRK